MIPFVIRYLLFVICASSWAKPSAESGRWLLSYAIARRSV